MKVMWKAACAVVLLIAATTIEIGCGETYRPVATPLPVTTGNPSGFETEIVLSCCLDPRSLDAVSGAPSSKITGINVSGDTNAGNKVLANVASSLTFDYSRSIVFSTNPATLAMPDSVTQVTISPSTAGFSATNNTIVLEQGSKPISMSFQYFGVTYTQDYVVNSGATPTCPNGGSLGVINQAGGRLKTPICLDVDASTHANPVLAWIYKDQTKVFVLDNNASKIYVVSASKYKVTNTILLPVGSAPIKAAQSADGNHIYVLDSGNGGSISIIDGQMETAATISTHSALSVAGSLPIDIAQDTNFNDTTKNTQVNHVWILQGDGTVSVYDGTAPGVLTWITSLSTITPAQYAAGVRPTNLALMRDGTQAYVGLAGTNQIVAINTSKLAQNAVTTNATSAITLDVVAGGVSHRNITRTINGKLVTVENTTPTVNFVAVSRGGNTADLSKVYATTTTSTTYFYYDSTGTQTSSATYPNLFNGTAVVTAADNGTTPINTFVTTVLAPAVLTDCDTGNPATGEYDGQKSCPAMVPTLVLGRS